jgi:hypothetical protein
MSRRRGECQVDHEALHCWRRARNLIPGSRLSMEREQNNTFGCLNGDFYSYLVSTNIANAVLASKRWDTKRILN